MSRRRLTLLAATLAVLAAAPGAALAGAVVLDLRSDPLDASAGAPRLLLQGPGAGLFAYDAGSAPAFPSDAGGSLVAAYDAARPALRAAAPLGAAYTEQDDFVFGAILTIRGEGFEADPFGFHPITFSLVNQATTGFDRTGSLDDFRADTFDSVDVAYFPQVSPFFGGPFLTPAVFGTAVSDDAFAAFAFGSGPFEIVPDVPHLVVAEHDAAARRLVVTVFALGRGGRPVPLPGGRVEASLASVPAFRVDALAVAAYEDGFNVFAPSGRSLRADVEYDFLFFAPGRLGEAGELPPPAGLLHRATEGSNGLATP